MNGDDEILYANSRAHLYLGLPEDEGEAIPVKFMEQAGKQYRPQPEEVWAAWTEGSVPLPESPRYLVRPESEESEAFWLQVDVLEMPAQMLRHRVILLRDVTSLITTQRDMRSFHGLISHKLRTPFTGILGSLQLLVDSGAEMSGDDIKEFSMLTLESAERFYKEIENILMYLDAPGLAKLKERFCFSQFESTVAELGAAMDIRSITVMCPEALRKATLALSQKAVNLILREVLENAVKFHPEQSPVVEVSVSGDEVGKITIKIGDDGLTLSPEQLVRMWAPYYQCEKYFTGQAEGIGLGLAMVAALVWGTGGACRAHNQQGKAGIVIELVLPLAEDGGEMDE